MRDFYPEIEPYQTQRLRVDAVHQLYVEEVGNPDGEPVVFFLHGGPGAGISPAARRFFLIRNAIASFCLISAVPGSPRPWAN